MSNWSESEGERKDSVDEKDKINDLGTFSQMQWNSAIKSEENENKLNIPKPKVVQPPKPLKQEFSFNQRQLQF